METQNGEEEVERGSSDSSKRPRIQLGIVTAPEVLSSADTTSYGNAGKDSANKKASGVQSRNEATSGKSTSPRVPSAAVPGEELKRLRQLNRLSREIYKAKPSSEASILMTEVAPLLMAKDRQIEEANQQVARIAVGERLSELDREICRAEPSCKAEIPMTDVAALLMYRDRQIEEANQRVELAVGDEESPSFPLTTAVSDDALKQVADDREELARLRQSQVKKDEELASLKAHIALSERRMRTIVASERKAHASLEKVQSEYDDQKRRADAHEADIREAHDVIDHVEGLLWNARDRVVSVERDLEDLQNVHSQCPMEINRLQYQIDRSADWAHMVLNTCPYDFHRADRAEPARDEADEGRRQRDIGGEAHISEAGSRSRRERSHRPNSGRRGPRQPLPAGPEADQEAQAEDQGWPAQGGLYSATPPPSHQRVATAPGNAATSSEGGARAAPATFQESRDRLRQSRDVSSPEVMSKDETKVKSEEEPKIKTEDVESTGGFAPQGRQSSPSAGDRQREDRHAGPMNPRMTCQNGYVDPNPPVIDDENEEQGPNGECLHRVRFGDACGHCGANLKAAPGSKKGREAASAGHGSSAPTPAVSGSQRQGRRNRAAGAPASSTPLAAPPTVAPPSAALGKKSRVGTQPVAVPKKVAKDRECIGTMFGGKCGGKGCPCQQKADTAPAVDCEHKTIFMGTCQQCRAFIGHT